MLDTMLRVIGAVNADVRDVGCPDASGPNGSVAVGGNPETLDRLNDHYPAFMALCGWREQP